MTIIVFAYPSKPHVRKHGPCGYDPYGGYKPWLRDEFTFRCVYCLERENWYPSGDASFSADHVVPQSEDESRICDYTNLIYACTRCNSFRREIRTLDPTAVALGSHLQLGADGKFVSLTPDGQDLIDLLHLNDGKALKTRRKYLQRAAIYEKYPGDHEIKAMMLEDLGFPANLPDLLHKKPPGGNTMEANKHMCYFARRERGELPETY